MEKFTKEEINDFLNYYNNSKDFKKMIQDEYKTNKQNLSELEVYVLENIIKYQPYETEVYNGDLSNYYPPYIRYKLDTNENIKQSAIMIYAAQLVRYKLKYKDGLVPYSDFETALMFLKEYFLANEETVRLTVDRIAKDLLEDYYLPQWFTNVPFLDVFMGIKQPSDFRVGNFETINITPEIEEKNRLKP